MKRYLSILLAAVMVVSLLPLNLLSVVAENSYEIFRYTVADGKVTVTGCDYSASGDIVIPSEIEGYPVTAIGDWAFAYTGITGVTLPDSIAEIGNGAFYLTNITYISLPAGLLSIGDEAFGNCNNLGEISLPESLTYLGASVFLNCGNITEITVPEGVKDIQNRTFSSCSNLKKVTFSEGVKVIGQSVFEGCYSLNTVLLPQTLAYIGDSAFQSTPITEIVIPDEVEYIGDNCFAYCNYLTSAVLPENLTYLGYRAFYSTGITEVAVYGNSAVICDEAFDTTNLFTVHIGAGVESISSTAFQSYQIQTITVDDSNKHYYGENNCLIERESKKLVLGCVNSVIPEGVAEIGDSAFASSHITSVTIPEGVTKIGDRAFTGSGIGKLILPESLTYIGESAFASCTSWGFDSIHIPANVEFIGELAFANCPEVDKITVSAANKYYYAEGNCLIKTDEKKLIQGGRYSVIPEGITEIGNYAFSGMQIYEAAIPEGVTRIGNNAFGGCVYLSDITLPSSLTYIGERAFSGCSGLDEIEIPHGVEYIETRAFERCNGLTSVMLPESVTYMGDEVFSACENLVNVSVPDSLKFIGSGNCNYGLEYNIYNNGKYLGNEKNKYVVFAGPVDNTLASCEIHPDTKHISSMAFYDGKISNISIPNGVLTIGDYAFGYCWNLESINLPKTLTHIGENAFRYCAKPTTVSIPISVANMEKGVFDGTYLLESIYCEAESKPDGWDEEWIHGCVATVYWAHKCSIKPGYKCTDDKYCQCGTLLEKGKDHSYSASATPPTCTEQGYTVYTCSACGDNYTSDYVPENGHSFGEWYVIVAPGCEAEGENRRDCADCDEYKTETTDPAGHSYVEEIIPPTCTEWGKTIHTCENCGASYEDNYIENREHNYIPSVFEPTCTERGYTVYTCSACGDNYTSDYVPENGHSFGEWYVIVAPGCETAGENRRDCAACGEYETETTGPAGHSYAEEIIPPTCTEWGKTVHTCSACGDSYTDDYAAPNNHVYGGWYVYNDETGEEHRDCNNCDEFESRSGHQFSFIVTPPTCSQSGYTTYTCACGESYVSDYTEKLEHLFAPWDTVIEPTCSSNGEEITSCIYCYIVDTRVIPALSHTHGEWVTVVEPEIGIDGLKEQHCVNCGELVASEVIPALKPALKLGDVTGDDKIDQYDYICIKRYCMGTFKIDKSILAVADVTGDGKVDQYDYICVKRHCMGTYKIEQ